MTTNTTTNTIAEGMEVTLNFAIMLSDGGVVDSNFETKPATFVMGDGNLLPGFEEVLVGLTVGDEQTFTLLPEKAFGQPNPNNVQSFKKDQFADVDLEPGLMLSFADANKAELPGVVKSILENEVIVDFNHPLAGETLEFKVKIVDVQPAQEQATAAN
ncbi:FKBP-type peptidyl-prolyl cis-trans isomerase [Litoribrevibacter albus]|uniref:Peptidyl-prolyl cis-trans isomerase n=1 Tax=Litoribrevibacter albus TaxID=1473156 RepID=A0AA37WAG3_9GAMM|nr:FKBP-type peptidyl-prolyl cis-trans isomerase [Litoribrevibacter albus]GLQ33686.1 peptidyl-prolyl cis-trans isomerase [Litoribrevibacter albus]